MSKYCQCGCGQLVSKPGNKYIYCHYIRVNPPMHNPETVKKWSETMKGRPKSEEHNRKNSEAQRGEKNHNYGKYGPASSAWKEECDHYGVYHGKAGKLFRQNHCEKCGLTSEEHLKKNRKNLDMHCTSIPKDYSIMEPENWQTLCKSCHRKIENKLRREESE